MSQSIDNMASFCKESNKFVGLENFLVLKKIIELELIENEVMEYVLSEDIEPRKESRTIKLKERVSKSIKNHCGINKRSSCSFVANLKTPKDMYDKL